MEASELHDKLSTPESDPGGEDDDEEEEDEETISQCSITRFSDSEDDQEDITYLEGFREDNEDLEPKGLHFKIDLVKSLDMDDKKPLKSKEQYIEMENHSSSGSPVFYLDPDDCPRVEGSSPICHPTHNPFFGAVDFSDGYEEPRNIVPEIPGDKDPTLEHPISVVERFRRETLSPIQNETYQARLRRNSGHVDANVINSNASFPELSCAVRNVMSSGSYSPISEPTSARLLGVPRRQRKVAIPLHRVRSSLARAEHHHHRSRHSSGGHTSPNQTLHSVINPGISQRRSLQEVEALGLFHHGRAIGTSGGTKIMRQTSASSMSHLAPPLTPIGSCPGSVSDRRRSASAMLLSSSFKQLPNLQLALQGKPPIVVSKVSNCIVNE